MKTVLIEFANKKQEISCSFFSWFTHELGFKMKIFNISIVLFVFSLFFGGCKSPEEKFKDQLVGMWSGQLQVTDETDFEQVAAAAMSSEIRIYIMFNADNTVDFLYLNDDETRTYEILSATSDSAIINYAIGSNSEGSEKLIEFISPNEMRWDFERSVNNSELFILYSRMTPEQAERKLEQAERRSIRK